MIPVLAYAVTALAVLWCGLCAWLGWRDRLINDGVLLVAAVLEIGLVVLAVLAVARFRQIDPAAEGE